MHEKVEDVTRTRTELAIDEATVPPISLSLMRTSIKVVAYEGEEDEMGRG